MTSVNFPTAVTSSNNEVSQTTVNSKLKFSAERVARERYQDFGTSTSSPDNAAEGNSLPGKESCPSSRRRSLVPLKPSPPPTARVIVTNRLKRSTSLVTPYTAEPRSHIKDWNSPPMARSGVAGALPPEPPPKSSSLSDLGRENGVCDSGTKTPVPPPRRKKKRNSTETVRAPLPAKPEPPPSIRQQEKSVKPPVVTPRKQSLESEKRAVGEVCEASSSEVAPTVAISVSEQHNRTDVSKTLVDGDLRKESVSVLLENNDNNTYTLCNHESGVNMSEALTPQDDSDRVTGEENTTVANSAKTCPPIPQKRTRIPTPLESPLKHSSSAQNDEGVNPQDTFTADSTTSNVNSQITDTNGQPKNDTISQSRDTSVDTPASEGEDDTAVKKGVRRLTMQFEDKFQPPSSFDPTTTRHTLANRPAKPPVPPKSPSLSQRVKQRPPVPRPRSGNFPRRREKEPRKTNSSGNLELNGSQNVSPTERQELNRSPKHRPFGDNLELKVPPKCSPAHGKALLQPAVSDLAVSSPSLPTLFDNHNNPHSNNDGNSSQTRKASSCSPNHVHVLPPQPQANGQLLFEGFVGAITKSTSHLSSHGSPVRNSTAPPIPPVRGTTRAKSVSLQSSPVKNSPARSKTSPKRMFSSVSDILEIQESQEKGTEGTELMRELVDELKTVKGRGKGEGDGKIAEDVCDSHEERLRLEDAESHTTTATHPQSPKVQNAMSVTKGRAVSVGDISLLIGVSPPQTQIGFSCGSGTGVNPPRNQMGFHSGSDIGVSLLHNQCSLGGSEAGVTPPHHQQQTGYPIGSDTSSYTSSEGRASVMSSDTQSLLERVKQLSRNKKWCDQPEVKESGVLPNMEKDQLLQQEAIFEIITSEATYHLNLTTLIDTFMDDPKMDPNAPESDHVLDRTQHSIIFSNVKEIRRISARFLEEIVGLLNDDVLLRKIFPILEDYAINRFVCYERYCASHSHRLKELRECTEKNENFQRQLKKLEEAANQTLQSLVTAPMQRVTKLPLLMSEILKRTPPDDPSHGQMELTHRATQETADLCNKGAGKIGDLVHLETIWKKLHFGNLKPFLILGPGRKLKKEGSIERLKMNKKRSRVMPDKVQHYLFIFTDLFMITTEDKDRHHVIDYCPLTKMTIESILTNPSHSLDTTTLTSTPPDDSYTMSGAEWTVAVAGEDHAFVVTMQESAAAASGKQGGGGGTSESSYIFVVKSEAEKTKWMDVLKEKTAKEIVTRPPKALTGRNLTMIARKQRREGPTKKYWWKQPQVEKSGVVKTLSQQELELQEAIFEIVTSEEEHLAAMETLRKHYMQDSGLDPSLPEEQRVLSEEEYDDIFRYVEDVHQISAGLLKTLQERQRDNIVVDTVCDILLLSVERRFQGYIRYCTNLPNNMEQLEASIVKNESFRGYLKQLEEDQPPLRALLMAPMVRVGRLPELMKIILKRTPPVDLNYSLVETTLRALEKVEKLCTYGQQKVAKIKELYFLENQLDFGHLKPFSLVSVGRSLLKKGSITKLKVTQWFGKAVKKKRNHLIILTDYLLITKKIDNVFKVMDTAPLDRIVVEVVEPHSLDHNTSLTGGVGEDTLAAARWAVSKAGENHAFMVTLPDVRRSYTFVASSEVERVQWIESLTVQNLMSFEDITDTTLNWEYFYLEAVCDYTPDSDTKAAEDLDMKKGDILRVYRIRNDSCEGLRVHDLQWGRIPSKYLAYTQGGFVEERRKDVLVEVTHDFPGSESGELQLEKGDVVKLVRQMAGWCEGKKLRGNQWGWFPNTFIRTLTTISATSSRNNSLTISPLPSRLPSPLD